MKTTVLIIDASTHVIANPKTLLHRPGLWFFILRARHRLVGLFKKFFIRN